MRLYVLIYEPFQSTLPRGERLPMIVAHAVTVGFNPRSRAGSDWCHLPNLSFIQSFNPRSRAGSDTGPAMLSAPGPVSIHAPARGATAFRQRLCSTCKVSIHAPARGATRNQTRPRDAPACFNPRSRAGSDAETMVRSLFLAGFNPRSRAGSDIGQSATGRPISLFQSTLPRGERLRRAGEGV